MYKNRMVIMALCFFVIACDSNGRPKKPDNLLAKSQMAEVMYDLYIINAAKGVNKKLLEINGFIPETYILKKHNIDSIQFADSNTYYAFDTDVYEAIVDKVKARLEKEKSEFEELQKIEDKAAKIRRDSINKIRTRKRDSIRKEKNMDSLIQEKKKGFEVLLDSTEIN